MPRGPLAAVALGALIVCAARDASAQSRPSRLSLTPHVSFTSMGSLYDGPVNYYDRQVGGLSLRMDSHASIGA
jgi:hypothetical protein